MTVAEYLVGLGVVAVAGLSSVVVARVLRLALTDALSGPPALLADVVLAVAVLVSVMQALGAVGLLGRWLLVGTLLAAATVALVHARRAGLRGAPSARTATGVRLSLVVALAVVAPLVLARWVRETADSFRLGMTEYDTLWYHMPFAARFVQDGWVVRPHYVGSEPNAFLPAASELLHTLGMLAFTSDFLSPLVNGAWAAVFLLAAWCVGRPFGAGAAAAAAGGVVAALPIVVITQPGSAQSDIAGLALFVAAVAFFVTDWNSPRIAVLAAVAAGLSVSTKPTLLAPTLALGVGSVLTARRRRPVAIAWCVGLLATGSFWYLRNLVYTGNPFPWFDLELGGLTLPSTDASVDCGQSTVASTLADGSWRRLVYPQLSRAFGPAWAPLLVLVVAGVVAGLATRRRPNVTLAGVALAAGTAYVLTPATAGGANAACFVYNTRFATPAIALSLLALVVSVPRRGRLWTLGIVGTLAALAVATSRPELATSLVISFVLVAVALAVWLGVRPIGRDRRALLAAAAVIAATVSAGWVLQDAYGDHRYAGRELSEPLATVSRVLGPVRDARIAVVGLWRHYPLYAPDLSNRVDFPYVTREGAEFRAVATCGAWIDALRRGRYDYVVIVPRSEQEAVVREWTEAQPFRQLVDRPDAAVLELVDAGAADQAPRCPRTGQAPTGG